MDEHDTDAYRVRVTIRNNRLLSAIEDAGYKGWGSQARFCRDAGITTAGFGPLANLKQAPIGVSGEFSATAKAIMEFLGASPSDLWTSEQLTMELDSNSAERPITQDQVMELLSWSDGQPSVEDVVDIAYIKRAVGAVIDTLPMQQANVLRLRFGIDCKEQTLEAVGKAMGVTREHVRRIEQKAIRNMKSRSRSDQLRDIYETS